jgi:hypothetical protein
MDDETKSLLSQVVQLLANLTREVVELSAKMERYCEQDEVLAARKRLDDCLRALDSIREQLRKAN